MDFLEEIKLALGMRYSDSDGWLKITHVLDGGIAQLVGLAPNDILSSINNQRITSQRIDQILESLKDSQKITFHFFRQDQGYQATTPLVLNPPPQYELKLTQ